MPTPAASAAAGTVPLDPLSRTRRPGAASAVAMTAYGGGGGGSVDPKAARWAAAAPPRAGGGSAGAVAVSGGGRRRLRGGRLLRYGRRGLGLRLGRPVSAVVSVSVCDVSPRNWYSPCHGRQTTCCFGSVQSSTGAFARTRDMNRFQIVAGKLPPETEMPWTFVISIVAVG